MELISIRQKFVELSGCFDLVKDTEEFADNGADFYLNAGQEFLDRRSNNLKKLNSLFIPFAIGRWYTAFQRCRTIKEVWVNTTAARWKLVKKSSNWLQFTYPGLISATDNGDPLYYCPANTRSTVFANKNDLGEFFRYVMDNDDSYRGVVIMPPPSEAIIVEIVGQFYSNELTEIVSESFWTINHPNLLILAGLYQLEILRHRNTEGARDYLGQIDIALSDIDKDLVEEEIEDSEREDDAE